MHIIRSASAAFLIFFLTLPIYPVEQATRIGSKVTFTTRDGIKISGLYQPPSHGRQVFVLLHGLASNQEEWQPFVRSLVLRGYGFLSYDARGHGQSTFSTKGEKISYESFGAPEPDSQWNRMADDLRVGVNFLVNVKNIPKKKIGLMGASLGANVCLIYASQDKDMHQIILLSPGLNYAGLSTSDSITALNDRAIAIAASPGDTYAYQSSSLLYQKIQSNKRAVFITGSNSRHGVQMFDGIFDKKILNWLSAAR